MIKDIPARSDPNFTKEINDIIKQRWKNDLDTDLLPRRIVERKITRHPLWSSIKLDLYRVPFVDEEGFR